MALDRRKAAATGGGALVTAAMVAAIAAWTAPRTAPFEGFRSCPYVDRIGKGHPWTVGYGHTGPDVRPGICITKAQGQALLAKDEEIAARKVAACSPPYVVRNRFFWGAATDFALNTGYYCTTSMARLFAAGRPGEACAFYNRYVYASGKAMNGLVYRRRYFSGLCSDGLREAGR